MKKKIDLLGMVAHAFTPELKRQRQMDLCGFEVSLVYIVLGQPGLHREKEKERMSQFLIFFLSRKQ